MSAPVTFTGARAVAQHCAELLMSGARNPLEQSRLPEVAMEAAARLGQVFGRMLGGARVTVSASAPRTIPTGELAGDSDPLSAYSVLNAPGDQGQIVLRIDGIALLKLTEQVFGGEAGGDHDLPDTLPLIASLLAAQLQTLIAATLSDVLGLAEGFEVAGPSSTPAAAIAVLSRHACCHAITFTLTQPERPDCTADLIVCPSAHAALFAAAANARGEQDRSSVPALLAISGVPLGLRAVVAEFSLPLTDVARLRTGDTVPTAMARSVKLKVGDLTVADATVGTVDGQAALQLVRVF